MTRLLLLAFALLSCAGRAPPPPEPVARAWPHPAPERYGVRLETSRGVILFTVDRSLAPIGADRFYNLVRSGYYNGSRMDRVIPGFIAQFGFAADPAVTAAEADVHLPMEPVKKPNTRGTLAWTNSGGGDDRSTVVFVNLTDSPHLDAAGQTVFGQVTDGMGVLDRLPASCPDLSQELTRTQGEAYLAQACPDLLVIRRAVITGDR